MCSWLTEGSASALGRKQPTVIDRFRPKADGRERRLVVTALLSVNARKLMKVRFPRRQLGCGMSYKVLAPDRLGRYACLEASISMERIQR